MLGSHIQRPQQSEDLPVIKPTSISTTLALYEKTAAAHRPDAGLVDCFTPSQSERLDGMDFFRSSAASPSSSADVVSWAVAHAILDQSASKN